MNNTIFAKTMANELNMESTSTRKCLERITESTWGFKPHEKSMEMGYLSFLVAEIPAWIAWVIEKGDIDLVTFPHEKPANAQELAAYFNKNAERAVKALEAVTDSELDATFNLKSNGQVLYSTTKKEMIASTINHMVHHRGQLTVYMRLNDIAVPSIYGPSADDRNF
jgi:Uncharacterized protein conserved in bacteria